MKAKRFDRSARLLLISPEFRDRSLMQRNTDETVYLFDNLSIKDNERLILQRYVDKSGWITVKVRGHVRQQTEAQAS